VFRPSVLYVDSVRNPCATLIATIGTGVKVVVRQSYLECAPFPGPLARRLFGGERVAALVCDISPDTAGDATTARQLSHKISLLPDGLNTDWYEKGADLREFGVPGAAFTIACASDATGDASLRCLIEAAHWIPMDLPIHFLIVTPSSEHERLRRVIRKMPFTQRFHLCDRLDRAPGLIGSSSVAVLTDWESELQRRACMQSLALGVPVFGVGTIARVIRPQINGELFARNNPESLARSLFDLYENPERRQMLGDGAKRSARERPSMTEHLMKLRAFLESALAA
jgi:glycosyltransferase involved in cell wall biosynthesis